MSLRSWPNSPGLRRYKAIQYVLIFDFSIWLKLFYRVLLLEKDLQLRIKTAKRMWLSLIFENNHVAEMYGFRNCWKYLWYSEFLIFFSYILSYFLFFFFLGSIFFFSQKILICFSSFLDFLFAFCFGVLFFSPYWGLVAYLTFPTFTLKILPDCSFFLSGKAHFKKILLRIFTLF